VCADALVLLTPLELCGWWRIAMAAFAGDGVVRNGVRGSGFQCACRGDATYRWRFFLRGLRLRKKSLQPVWRGAGGLRWF